MEFKGSASLGNRNINALKKVFGDLDLRIERINQNVGRVYVVDQVGNMQPLPLRPNGRPVITMVDRAGMDVAPHNEEFLYVFGDSFSVAVNGDIVLCLDLQKQHSVLAPRAVRHEKIEPLG
jgi:hypothetical protein